MKFNQKIDSAAFTKVHHKNKLMPNNDNNQEYDIFYSIRPLHFMMSIFGMSKFTNNGGVLSPVGNVTKLFSLILSVAVIVCGVFNIFIMLKSTYASYPEIVLVIYILATALTIMTASLGIFKSAFINSKKITKMIMNVKDIDKKLDIKGKTPYARLQTYIIIFIVAFVISEICHYVYANFCNVDTGYGILTFWLDNLINFLTLMQLVDFSVILWINVTRMNVLNKRLKEVLADVTKMSGENLIEDHIEKKNNVNEIFIVDGNSDKNKITSFKIQQISDRILYIIKIFDIIADNIQIINNCYGLFLLLASTTTFLNIMSTINGLILFDKLRASNENITFFLITLWCLPITLFLLIAAYVAEVLRDEIEDSSVTIDKLTINPIINSDHLELLECFSQMLTGRKVFVTANNFFSFDSSFVFSLIGTVATYTVILMQVNDPTAVANSLAKFANSTNTTYANVTNGTYI